MRWKVDHKSDRDYWLDLVLVFFVVSMMGWIWEVVLILVQSGDLTNRGVLHGPWLPIYGSGGVLMIWMKERLPGKWWVFFLSSMVACGVVEYIVSWVLEQIYHTRWWDYTSMPINLNGRICLSGLLVFGLGGLFLVYLLYPRLKRLFSRIPQKNKKVIAFCLGGLFCIDTVYSLAFPNML